MPELSTSSNGEFNSRLGNPRIYEELQRADQSAPPPELLQGRHETGYDFGADLAKTLRQVAAHRALEAHQPIEPAADYLIKLVEAHAQASNADLYSQTPTQVEQTMRTQAQLAEMLSNAALYLAIPRTPSQGAAVLFRAATEQVDSLALSELRDILQAHRIGSSSAPEVNHEQPARPHTDAYSMPVLDNVELFITEGLDQEDPVTTVAMWHNALDELGTTHNRPAAEADTLTQEMPQFPDHQDQTPLGSRNAEHAARFAASPQGEEADLEDITTTRPLQALERAQGRAPQTPNSMQEAFQPVHGQSEQTAVTSKLAELSQKQWSEVEPQEVSRADFYRGILEPITRTGGDGNDLPAGVEHLRHRIEIQAQGRAGEHLLPDADYTLEAERAARTRLHDMLNATKSAIVAKAQGGEAQRRPMLAVIETPLQPADIAAIGLYESIVRADDATQSGLSEIGRATYRPAESSGSTAPTVFENLDLNYHYIPRTPVANEQPAKPARLELSLVRTDLPEPMPEAYVRPLQSPPSWVEGASTQPSKQSQPETAHRIRGFRSAIGRFGNAIRRRSR